MTLNTTKGNNTFVCPTHKKEKKEDEKVPLDPTGKNLLLHSSLNNINFNFPSLFFSLGLLPRLILLSRSRRQETWQQHSPRPPMPGKFFHALMSRHSSRHLISPSRIRIIISPLRIRSRKAWKLRIRKLARA